MHGWWHCNQGTEKGCGSNFTLGDDITYIIFLFGSASSNHAIKMIFDSFPLHISNTISGQGSCRAYSLNLNSRGGLGHDSLVHCVPDNM